MWFIEEWILHTHHLPVPGHMEANFLGDDVVAHPVVESKTGRDQDHREAVQTECGEFGRFDAKVSPEKTNRLNVAGKNLCQERIRCGLVVLAKGLTQRPTRNLVERMEAV